MLTAEVESTILPLKENKFHFSTYPNRILKYISILVSPLLTTIINKTLTTGCFLKSLETGRVVSIFKTADRSILTNYRPIAILSVFSKVIEKMVHKQAQSFLDFFRFSILLNLNLDTIFQPLKLCLILCSTFITI